MVLEFTLRRILRKPTCAPVTGTSHLQVKDAPEINETVTTLHHDQPRFIYYWRKTDRSRTSDQPFRSGTDPARKVGGAYPSIRKTGKEK